MNRATRVFMVLFLLGSLGSGAQAQYEKGVPDTQPWGQSVEGQWQDSGQTQTDVDIQKQQEWEAMQAKQQADKQPPPDDSSYYQAPPVNGQYQDPSPAATLLQNIPGAIQQMWPPNGTPPQPMPPQPGYAGAGRPVPLNPGYPQQPLQTGQPIGNGPVLQNPGQPLNQNYWIQNLLDRVSALETQCQRCCIRTYASPSTMGPRKTFAGRHVALKGLTGIKVDSKSTVIVFSSAYFRFPSGGYNAALESSLYRYLGPGQVQPAIRKSLTPMNVNVTPVTSNGQTVNTVWTLQNVLTAKAVEPGEYYVYMNVVPNPLISGSQLRTSPIREVVPGDLTVLVIPEPPESGSP